MTARPRFPVGCIHHATHLKQSPPLDGDDYREFLRRELSEMKEVGFNSFVNECGWADLEAVPGEFDFSRTDIVQELCEELDLLVFVWVFAELTPRWLTEHRPETAAVAASGWRSPTHSWGNREALQAMRPYIQKVVGRYGRRPGTRAFNVGIESGFHWITRPDTTDPADRLFDYNADVVAGFPAFLEKRYGSIDALNRAWRDHYRSFDEIQPVKARFFRENPMLVNQVPWLDWRLHVREVMTAYLHFKAACVREVLPEAVVSDQSYEVDPVWNAQDPWQINEKMDVVGTSMFTSNAPGDYAAGNYLQDLHRSSGKGKPFWIWELRAGQNAWGLTNWGPPVSANDVARFTWQVVAQGARCLQYWNWRPHLGGLEVGGHGFLTREGTVSGRARRAGRIGRVLDANAEWALELQPWPSPVAILDSPVSRILAAGESNDALVVEAQRGAHALFRSQGFGVDFVSDGEIEAGILQRYRMLVLPFAYALSRATADRLREWVAGGGHVFAALFCGAKDERGFGQVPVPGHGLDAVFGVTEETVEPCFGPDDRPVSNLGEAWDVAITGRPRYRAREAIREGARCGKGTVIEGFRYSVVLRPAPGARVVAEDEQGRPTAVLHRHGDGASLYFGSFPIPRDPFGEEGLAALVADFAILAGAERPVVVEDRDGRAVEARLLEGPGGRHLVVVLNAEGRPAEATLAVPGRYLRRAVDLETGREHDIDGKRDATRLSLRLEAGDARAFKVEEIPARQE
jgi:beta-galactosidase GanA